MIHRWSTLEDDLPHLTPAQLAAHPDALEWWYFDFTDREGRALVFVLAHVNPLLSGTHRPSVGIEFQAGRGAPKRFAAREFAPGEFVSEPRPDGHEFRLGEANRIRLRRGPDGGVAAYELRFDLAGQRGDLVFTPRSPGFLPGGDGRYFHRPDDPAAGAWVNFAAPWQRVHGRVTWDGRVHELDGEGYHDHPWATESFFTTSAGWHWGRTYFETGAVMYADVHPLPPWQGRLKFLYEAPAGGGPRVTWHPEITYASEVEPFPAWLAALWPPASSRGAPDCPTSFRSNWLAMRQPRRTSLISAQPALRLRNRFAGWILRAPIYCRSLALTQVETAGPPLRNRPRRPGATRPAAGRGWVEYVSMPTRNGRLVLRLGRLLLRWMLLR